MEIKQYIYLFKKWIWLLVLGGLLGGFSAYFISSSQPTLYETTTRVMVSRAMQQESSNYYVYTDIQLVKTYGELLTTDQILQPLSERVGYSVLKNQIKVEQIPESLLLEVSVNDSDPKRAAQIANNLVEVFIDYNESVLTERYAASEQSLQTQIDQVEEQISALQAQLGELSEENLATQKKQVADRVKELEAQISTTSDEIVKLESTLNTFFPELDIPTPTSVPLWVVPTSTPVPVPTPTLSATEETEYKALQLRLQQQKELHDLYLDVYGQLLTLDDQEGATDQTQRQEYLQTTIALYQQIYSNLLNSYENVHLARLRSTPNIAQVEQASTPEKPIQPQPARDAVLGTVSGILIMGALAFLIEYLDDTLKTPEDINNHLHVPVIGLISEMTRKRGKDNGLAVYVAENPLSPITEAFRTLRSNLDFAGVDKPLKTLLVTSTGPSEGKSTVAVNLAAVMAHGERKVILMDADLRRPTIHRYLHIANHKGLSDLFREQNKFSNVFTTWGEPPMAVVTSGSLPPNPTELLASEKMEKILQELKGKSDIVILDSPPAIVADPLVLAAKVDGVLLIIEPGKTKIGAAQVVMEQMQRAGARVVGVVMNPISRRRAGYYTKYRYYSTYYYSHNNGNYFSNNGGSKKKNGEKVEEGNGRIKTHTK